MDWVAQPLVDKLGERFGEWRFHMRYERPGGGPFSRRSQQTNVYTTFSPVNITQHVEFAKKKMNRTSTFG
jgi:hypothetical protein